MARTRFSRSGTWADPVGEGHAGQLLGAALPPLTLASTEGPVALDELGAECLVLFLYPHATGLPAAPVPGWQLVPGAKGCTAQSCAFRDQHQTLADLGATVAGLSVQTVGEQQAFRARVGLRYRLISDPERRLAAALGLPTFTAAGVTFYKRLTLVAVAKRIVKVFYPIPAPERNATEVREWLAANIGTLMRQAASGGASDAACSPGARPAEATADSGRKMSGE